MKETPLSQGRVALVDDGSKSTDVCPNCHVTMQVRHEPENPDAVTSAFCKCHRSWRLDGDLKKAITDWRKVCKQLSE